MTLASVVEAVQADAHARTSAMVVLVSGTLYYGPAAPQKGGEVAMTAAYQYQDACPTCYSTVRPRVRVRGRRGSVVAFCECDRCGRCWPCSWAEVPGGVPPTDIKDVALQPEAL